MGIVLGIDVGGSTTKIVGFNAGEYIGGIQVRATDQITSMFGAIGSFLHKQSRQLCDVSLIVLTGVGASFFEGRVYDIDTCKVDEFTAIGRGGLYLSGLSEAIVVSMGTGTALVRATGESCTHMGGSGVGGGTLVGLALKMLGKSDIDAILDLAKFGSLRKVDLSVSDILGHEIPSLPPDLTAANFGKIQSTATESDLALGIINMIFETIGMMAVFAVRNDSLRDVVLTGALTTIPQATGVFTGLGDMCGVNFIMPPNAVFATAIGAAIQYV